MKGHPTIITENFCPLEETLIRYKGLIKCTVLPPKDLYLPVLPVRIDGKLMFPLCRSCAEMKNHGVCNHTDTERMTHSHKNTRLC